MNPVKESSIADIERNGYLGIERTLAPENTLETRKEYAETAISLWMHAASSDTPNKLLERKKVLEFIQLLFHEGSLFPASMYKEAEQKKILLDLVKEKEPMKIEEISEYLKGKKELILAFFYDACLLVYLDGKLVSTENDFLDTIAGEWGLTKLEKRTTMEKFQ